MLFTWEALGLNSPSYNYSYSKLEASGTLQQIIHSNDIPATRPFLDEDAKNAIEYLKASTAAIQKQTDILTTQCETLNKQIRLGDERALGKDRDTEQLRRKHESGRQNVNAAVMTSHNLRPCHLMRR